jgi:hypothetical protein
MPLPSEPGEHKDTTDHDKDRDQKTAPVANLQPAGERAAHCLRFSLHVRLLSQEDGISL